MANTYSQIYIHCVFAVKGRKNHLTSDFRDDLHKYMSVVLRDDNVFPLAVGGWHDHVHVFFELKPNTKVSDLMRILKATSSKWINDNRLAPDKFEWQSGYGAFSCSHGDRDRVIKYIMNQEEHHRRKTFREEYFELLMEMNVKFNEKYVFEFDEG